MKNAKFLAAVLVSGVVALTGGRASAQATREADAPASRPATRAARPPVAPEARPLLETGRQQMAKGDYQAAYDSFIAASAKDGQSIEIMLGIAAAAHELAARDPKYAGIDRDQCRSALALDGDCVEALRLVLKWDIEASRFAPQVFSEMAAVAGHLHELDHNDATAEAYRHVANVALWYAGGTLDAKQADAEISGLEAAFKKDPGNVDVPYYLAIGYLNKGRLLLGPDADGDAVKQAKEYFHKAAHVMEDAIAAQPGSAELQQRNAVVLMTIRQLLPAAATATTLPSEGSWYEALARDAWGKARELAVKGDPALVDIYIGSAQMELATGNHDKAVQILRDLCSRVPDDERARLALAAILKRSAETRGEAMSILNMPVAENCDSRGAAVGDTRPMLQLQRLVELEGMMVDAYASSTTRPATLLGDIRQNFQNLLTMVNGQDPSVLKLGARIELLEGKPDNVIRAIQYLEQAQDLLSRRGEKDYDMMFMLAKAYQSAGQSGRVRDLLEQVVAGNGDVPPRVMLAEVLLSAHELDKARQLIESLVHQAPEDPDVKRLEALLLLSGAQGPVNAPTTQRALDLLPEDSRDHKLQKAVVAAHLNANDQAERLLEGLRAETPADMTVVQALVQLYRSEKKVDKAQSVLDAAIAKDPNNADLQILKASLASGAKQEDIDKLWLKKISQNPDVSDREFQLFRYWAMHNDGAQALGHLDAAEQANPTNVQVLEQRFQLYLAASRWDDAQAYAQRLGAQNADKVEGRTYRFRVAMAMGKLNDALAIASEMTQKLPEFAQSWLMLGQVYQTAGQLQQAIRSYTTALERQSDNVEALRGLIVCYSALGRSQEAYKYIMLGRQGNPGDAGFRQAELDWMLKNGRLEEAMPMLVDALKASPDVLNNWIQLGQAEFELAQQSARQGKDADARKYIENAKDVLATAMQKWPDDKLPYAWTAQVDIATGDFPAGEAALKALAARDAFRSNPEPLFLLADFYQRFNQLDRAEQALREAVNRSQNSPAAQEQLAAFYSRLGHYDEALKALDPVSSDPGVQRQIVETNVSAGHLDEANRILQRELNLNPHDSALMTIHGMLSLRSGQLQEALAAFNQALTDDPRNARALYGRGLIRMSANPPDFDGAAADLTASAGLSPRDAEAHLALAELERRRGNPAEAARTLESFLAGSPDNKAARLRLAEVYSQVQPPRWDDAVALLVDAQKRWANDADWDVAEANLWLARNDAGKAAEKLTAALQKAPNNGQLWGQYLRLLQQVKKFAEMKDACDALLRRSGGDKAGPYEMRGVADMGLGNTQEAMADFGKALSEVWGTHDLNAIVQVTQGVAIDAPADEVLKRADGDDDPWRLAATLIHLRRNEGPKAVELIDRMMADPGKSDYELLLRMAGSLYSGAGDFDKAEEVYKKTLEKWPKDAGAYAQMAMILGEKTTPPKVRQAIDYAEHAYALMQSGGQMNPAFLLTYGWMLVLDEKFDKGIEILQQAEALSPTPQGYYRLGEAYLRRGDGPAALGALGKARELLMQLSESHQAFDAGLPDQITIAVDKAQKLPTTRPGP